MQIANSGASAGASSVYLGSSDASTFLYGIAASAPITSLSGTSQVSSLLVNASAKVSDDLIVDNGPIYISRSQVANTKKLVLYDNNTGNDNDFLGLFTSQSAGKSYFNNEIDGTGGAFRWQYGNGLGNSRVKVLEIDKAAITSQALTFSFLNSQTGGSTQNVTFIDDTLGTFYMNWKTNDSFTATQSRDAGIIVESGADGAEDDGTMSLVSGALSLTSNGLTQVNCVGLDLNASGAVEIDTPSALFLTAVIGDLFLASTNRNIQISTTAGVGANGNINLTANQNICFDILKMKNLQYSIPFESPNWIQQHRSENNRIKQ